VAVVQEELAETSYFRAQWFELMDPSALAVEMGDWVVSER
jgi:hypothetical protein